MDIAGDIRVALRSLRRRPAFTGVVIVTIAIALGATTSMMAVVNAAIVRPLPFRDPEQLVFTRGFAVREQDTRGLSFLEAADWRARSRAFDALAPYAVMSVNLSERPGASEPVNIDGEIVSADFFRVLGTPPFRGRTFLPDEDRVPDARPVVVIGHALWQSRFGGSESIVGRTIDVNGRPFTVVGIMPPNFRGASFEAQVWIPMMMVSAVRPVSELESRSSRWLRAVGRVRSGLTLDDAQRDLDRVAAELAREYPRTNTDRGALVVSLREFHLGTTRMLLLALLAAVGFLLLIACANVLSLQVVRATARRREMSVRVALGAGRLRIVRQLLVEGLVLAAAGTVTGVVLALWGIDILLPLAPPGLLPAYADVMVDAWVLARTAAIALAAGVAFGLVPALAQPSNNLVSGLKDGAPSAAAGLGSMRRLRAQHLFVIGQVALALVLLTDATLMVRSLTRQLAVVPGFRTDVVAARVMLPPERYGDSARVRFVEQLVQRASEMPGVTLAAAGSDAPLRGLESGGHVTYEGGSPDGVNFARHRVTPGYFQALGITIQRGRAFTTADGPNAPAVAIVSASTAKRIWPGREPIGQKLFQVGPRGPLPAMTVVGVAADVRFRDLTASLDAPREQVDVYLPFAQESDETVELVVQSESSVASTTAALRRAVNGLDPTLPVYAAAPISDALADETASARFGAVVLAVFAVIAIVLAAVGIYGLLAFVVGASRREIAIRMALGAASVGVIGLVVRKGMSLAGIGVLLGMLIAIPSARAMAELLFGVSAGDPLTMFVVTGVLLTVALLACWFPARRASRVSPQAALKSD